MFPKCCTKQENILKHETVAKSNKYKYRKNSNNNNKKKTQGTTAKE